MKKARPLRRCVGCGNMLPKNELLRVVRIAGQIHPDPSGKAQGRGAYVCRNSQCLGNAQKRRGLERSFKGIVTRDTYEELQKLF